MVLLFLFLFTGNLYATFFNSYSPVADKLESGKGVTKLSDGNYAVVGYSGSSYSENSGDKGWVLKISSSGSIIWSKFVSNYTVHFYGVAGTSDGGMVACGRINIGNTHRRNYLVKLSSSGSIVWETSYSDGINGGWGFFGVVALSTGDIAAYGYSEIDGDYHQVVKVSGSTGETIWSRKWTSVSLPHGIVEGDDENVVVGGDIYYPMLASLAIDTGAIQWAKHYDNTNSFGYGQFMTKTSDGGFALATTVETGNYYLAFIKVDSTGGLDFVSGVNFDSSSGGDAIARAVIGTPNGEFFLGGRIENCDSPGCYFKTVIAKFDKDGDYLYAVATEHTGGDYSELVRDFEYMGNDKYMFVAGTANLTTDSTQDGIVGTFYDGDVDDFCGPWMELPGYQVLDLTSSTTVINDYSVVVPGFSTFSEDTSDDQATVSAAAEDMAIHETCADRPVPAPIVVFDASVKNVISVLLFCFVLIFV